MGEAVIFSMTVLVQEYLLLEFMQVVALLPNNSYNDWVKSLTERIFARYSKTARLSARTYSRFVLRFKKTY